MNNRCYIFLIKLGTLFLVQLVFLPITVSFVLTPISSKVSSSLYPNPLSTTLFKSFKERTKTELQSKTPKSIPIIACSSTIELERAISFYLKPNDVVLELGSQLNDVSSLICDKIGVTVDENNDHAHEIGQKGHQNENKNYTSNGRAILVDIKRKDATSGRCKPRDIDVFLQRKNHNDQVQFHELEQFDRWRDVMKLGLDQMHSMDTDTEDNTTATTKSSSDSSLISYDVIILDIGTMIGNDLHLSALSITNEIIAQQQRQNSNLRTIIIKSKLLSNLARRIIHSQRLFDGSVILPKPEDMPRSTTPYIIASVGVNEYRRTIPFMVKPGDEIIEVGCHFGQTTVLLHEAATSCDHHNNDSNEGLSSSSGFCIGVDIGPKIIKHANTNYPHVPFVVGNAWNILQLLKIRYNRDIIDIHDSNQTKITTATAPTKFGYDLVYADIGGLSGADGLMESLSLLEAIGHGMEPRGIIIKSLCINRLASQLKAFSAVWNRIESLKKGSSE